jgi:hypothetical protein
LSFQVCARCTNSGKVGTQKLLFGQSLCRSLEIVKGKLAVSCVAGARDPNIETVGNVPRELQRRDCRCIFREPPIQGTEYIPEPRPLE